MYQCFLLAIIDILFKDFLLVVLIIIATSLVFIDILGNADNLITANPLSTPTHILPEWYYFIYYSILRAFPNKILGAVVVFINFVFLFTLAFYIISK